MSERRVYDADEVDTYVAHLHSRIVELETQVAAADDDTAAVVAGRTLVRAQELADELVAEATREASEIRAGAASQVGEVAALGSVPLSTPERRRQGVGDDVAATFAAEAQAEADALVAAASRHLGAEVATAEEPPAELAPFPWTVRDPDASGSGAAGLLVGVDDLSVLPPPTGAAVFSLVTSARVPRRRAAR